MQKAFWGYVINKIPPEINDWYNNHNILN
jgi:hypothetical protein